MSQARKITVEVDENLLRRAQKQSREGVTGAQETISFSLSEQVAQLRKLSGVPIAVGFGISNADQAR